MLIGKYYVQIKEAHLYWGKRRRTDSRTIREEESYIAIPAKYAYAYNIKKGDVYNCLFDNGKRCKLKAGGSQSRREYAKQFQGNGSLKIVYDWYMEHNAKVGDYVVVSIYKDNELQIEYVSADNKARIEKFNISGEQGKVARLSERENAGFRLMSLQVRNNEIEHCNIDFFSDDLKGGSKFPITTVIVGANGTGKSFVLKILAEIFNAAENPKAVNQLKYTYYHLKYILDGMFVEIEIINKAVIIHRNGVLLETNEEKVLPQKVLAVSFMLNDKFPFKQSNAATDEAIYEYLGVRMTSNASWTSSLGNKIAETLLSLASEEKLWDFMKSLSKYLDIEPKISIECEMPSNIFLENNVFEELRKRGEKIKEKEEFRSDVAKKLTIETYELLAEYIKNIKKENLMMQDGTKTIFGVSFDTGSSPVEIKKIVNDYKIIKILCSLKVVNSLNIYLYKNGERYSFEEASSGEKHVLYSFTNIFNSIKENSIVLIDEPEISLHPNWQMKYLSSLRDIFGEYNSCHFVIATHSHYLVSDLNPDSSSLITVEYVDGKKVFTVLDYSTYAWSAENILYNIFGARTMRNYYFDMDVRELLYAVSNRKSDEIERIQELCEKLSKFVLDEKDPLKHVIDETREYIRDVESGVSD